MNCDGLRDANYVDVLMDWTLNRDLDRVGHLPFDVVWHVLLYVHGNLLFDHVGNLLFHRDWVGNVHGNCDVLRNFNRVGHLLGHNVLLDVVMLLLLLLRLLPDVLGLLVVLLLLMLDMLRLLLQLSVMVLDLAVLNWLRLLLLLLVMLMLVLLLLVDVLRFLMVVVSFVSSFGMQLMRFPLMLLLDVVLVFLGRVQGFVRLRPLPLGGLLFMMIVMLVIFMLVHHIVLLFWLMLLVLLLLHVVVVSWLLRSMLADAPDVPTAGCCGT